MHICITVFVYLQLDGEWRMCACNMCACVYVCVCACMRRVCGQSVSISFPMKVKRILVHAADWLQQNQTRYNLSVFYKYNITHTYAREHTRALTICILGVDDWILSQKYKWIQNPSSLPTHTHFESHSVNFDFWQTIYLSFSILALSILDWLIMDRHNKLIKIKTNPSIIAAFTANCDLSICETMGI